MAVVKLGNVADSLVPPAGSPSVPPSAAYQVVEPLLATFPTHHLPFEQSIAKAALSPE